ncbi:hypothetical protein ACS0TY_017795 [Phlomoides rotata]
MGLALRFRTAVKEHRLFEILEKVVADEGGEDEILVVAKLTKRCLKVSGRKRPSMKEVAPELDLLRKRRELPGHQESYCDEDLSTSEKYYTFGIDSGVEESKAHIRSWVTTKSSKMRGVAFSDWIDDPRRYAIK